MFPELFAFSVLGSAAYGGYHMLRNVGGLVSTRRRQRTRRPGFPPAVHRAAHDLQVALIQVRDAPDFRRAASYATHARDVPLWFRQRQYHRFRSLLIEHLANLLNQGLSTETLMPGLTQLISGLGIAPFEADYLRTEAESRLSPQVTQAPDFGQRLREAQTAYRSRMRTLEGMRELDNDSREQLLEQEKQRFQEQLRAISGEGAVHEP